MFLRCYHPCSVGQNGYSWLELGISLPPNQVGSGNTPSGQALVDRFIWKAGLSRREGLSLSTERFLPLPCHSRRGVSSHPHSENRTS